MNKGQTILEYISLVGIIIVALLTMSQPIKRGVQGMVKTVADQMGNQQRSEQAFDETGHLVNSLTTAAVTADHERRERAGTVSYIVNDTVVSQSDTFLNLGFIERQQN